MMKFRVLALASCPANMKMKIFPRTAGEEMAVEVWLIPHWLEQSGLNTTLCQISSSHMASVLT